MWEIFAPAIVIMGIGIIFLIIKSAIDYNERKKKEELLLNSNMQDIDQLSGREFEEYLALILKRNGYRVELTKASGDFGADLILYDDSSSAPIIVQTKRYSNKVPLTAVQEVCAAINYYHAREAWVITNSYFTKPASELASASNIRLIDRLALAELICSTQGISELLTNFSTEGTLSVYTSKDTFLQYDMEEPKEVVSEKERVTPANLTFRQEAFQAQSEISTGTLSFDEIKARISKIESHKPTCQDNYITLHFFYQTLAEVIYSFRNIYERGIELSLELCEKDITIFKNTGLDAGITTITRKAIIYEKMGNIDEAIKVCDFGLKHNFLDRGRSFQFRKDRLLKKKERMTT